MSRPPTRKSKPGKKARIKRPRGPGCLVCEGALISAHAAAQQAREANETAREAKNEALTASRVAAKEASDARYFAIQARDAERIAIATATELLEKRSLWRRFQEWLDK